MGCPLVTGTLFFICLLPVEINALLLFEAVCLTILYFVMHW